MARTGSGRARGWAGLGALMAAGMLTGVAAASTVTTSSGRVNIAPMADALDEPWGIAFLPDSQFLVTERGGRLQIFPPEGGAGIAVSGVPDVTARGQGGLLDVMVPRDFETSREVWLSFARAAEGGGAGTALGVGLLSADGTALEGFRTVFAAPGAPGGNHFGSRITEAVDGTIFLTIGERNDGPLAQDAQRPEGKVLHLNRDGSPATTVPGWLPGVYSMGHRNPQAAALDDSGQLWVIEHGAQGGDEVNRVLPGRNYGWPVIAYGQDYGGDRKSVV